MRRKYVICGLLLLTCGLGLTLSLGPWQGEARSVEELLARIEPGMASPEVVVMLGQPEGNESFTRTDHYDGPPSMRPGLWDRVPLGTTVTHWVLPRAARRRRRGVRCCRHAGDRKVVFASEPPGALRLSVRSAEPPDVVDRAGVTVSRRVLSFQPARHLILTVRRLSSRMVQITGERSAINVHIRSHHLLGSGSQSDSG